MENQCALPDLVLEMLLENNEVIKIDIKPKLAGNREKCKLLISKSEQLWHGIPILYDCYEIKNRVIYATECRDARYFSADVLRASFLMRDDLCPSCSIAFSNFGGQSYAKAVLFTFI